MKEFTILVTTSGSVTAQCVIKALRNQDEYKVRVVTTDITDITAGKYIGDAFYVLPSEKEEDAYVEKLIDVTKREKVDIIIPIHDNELSVTSKYKKHIEKEGGTHLFVSDFETIERCNDKALTNKFFAEEGIPIPRVFTEKELADPDALPYPLFLKPRKGVSAIHVYKASSPEELRFYIQRVEGPIVQEYVGGREFSIDAYMTLRGTFINAIPRERVAIRGGASFIGKTMKRLDMIETAKKICEKLRIIGPANIQCFERDPTEGPLYFEVNPRFSAAHIFSVQSGLESVLWMLREYDGKEIAPRVGEMREIEAFRYWQEIFIDAKGNKLVSYPLV